MKSRHIIIFKLNNLTSLSFFNEGICWVFCFIDSYCELKASILVVESKFCHLKRGLRVFWLWKVLKDGKQYTIILDFVTNAAVKIFYRCTLIFPSVCFITDGQWVEYACSDFQSLQMSKTNMVLNGIASTREHKQSHMRKLIPESVFSLQTMSVYDIIRSKVDYPLVNQSHDLFLDG